MGFYDAGELYKALADLQVINGGDLDTAWKESQKENLPFEDLLIDRGLITDENLGKVISELIKVPLVRLDQVSINKDDLQIIPEIVAKTQKALVFGRDEKGIKIAMVNPKNTEFAELVAKKTGENAAVYLATSRDLEQALSLYKKDLQKTFDELLAEQVNKAGKGVRVDAPIAKIVDLLIEYAYTNRASDIHIEPEKKHAQVRFRVDGVLHEVLNLPKNVYEQVVAKIKVEAKLRTDEKMSAQDGKMQAEMPDEELDIRVSIVPIVNGEKVVLRLLSSKSRQISLADLGMRKSDLDKVESGFNKPFGMVLSTGPTGSGKTTSIYAILKILNKKEINIATIEDPVEYDIENINQIQVNPKTNLTFASGLRAILRQDPNVIFVGEIRDKETADIAVNAALTGHLVLSTLHTNDAATTLPRLIDMEVEPFLVASTVNVIIGQRLVRKICEKCRVSVDITLKQAIDQMGQANIGQIWDNQDPIRIYKGKGCPVCHNTGYAGRVGIFEVLTMSDGIRELITARATSEQIKDRAIKEGMQSMQVDGLYKVQQGITTMEEVLRASKQ